MCPGPALWHLPFPTHRLPSPREDTSLTPSAPATLPPFTALAPRSFLPLGLCICCSPAAARNALSRSPYNPLPHLLQIFVQCLLSEQPVPAHPGPTPAFFTALTVTDITFHSLLVSPLDRKLQGGRIWTWRTVG